MSGKYPGFWTPSPYPHLVINSTIESMQPHLLCLDFGYPLPLPVKLFMNGPYSLALMILLKLSLCPRPQQIILISKFLQTYFVDSLLLFRLQCDRESTGSSLLNQPLCYTQAVKRDTLWDILKLFFKSLFLDDCGQKFHHRCRRWCTQSVEHAPTHGMRACAFGIHCGSPVVTLTATALWSVKTSNNDKTFSFLIINRFSALI